MLLLAASVGSANAGSFLDPYSHIAAPQGTAPKTRNSQKEPRIVPQVDEVEQATTYVAMPMGHLAEDGQNKKKKEGGGGILSKTTGIFAGVGNGVAKSGKMFANGAGAAGGLAKKSGTLIGTGVKSTGDKIKDSKDAVSDKIASNKPASKKAAKTEKQSPNRTASVDDWYTKEAANTLAHNKDNGKRAGELVKRDPTKHAGIETAYLGQKGGKKAGLGSKLNPFNKLSKKTNDKDNNQVEIRPASGFADGAANPDEEVLAAMQREKAAKLAAKQSLESGDKEKFTPIVATPEPEKNTSKVAAKTESKKKSKFNIVKAMPGLPSFGKKQKSQPTSIATAPKKDKKDKQTEVKGNDLDQLTEVDSVAKIDPNAEEDITPASSPMALRTGDKKIDAATPKGQAHKEQVVAAKKPAKKSKFGGMGMASLSKFNFMNKKNPAAPPQSATKTDAAKQM